MKIVHRYILSQAVGPYLVGLFAFSLVVLLHRFSKLADLVIAKGVPPSLVGKLLLALVPAFLEIALPSALLLAVLLSLGRLAADSETTALRAAGIGMRGLVLPVLILSGGTFLASLLIGGEGIPWGQRTMRETLARIVALRAGAAAEEHVFQEIAPGVLLFPDRVSPDGTRMSGVFLSESVGGREALLVFAREGTFVPGNGAHPPRLLLADGEIHHDTPSGGSYRYATFRSMELRLPRVLEEAGGAGDPRGLAFGDLLRKARDERGTPAGASALFHFHRRVALSISCLAFGLLALPIGFMQRARGKSPALAVTIALILVFYIFLAAAGAVEQTDPRLMVLLMWLPDILGLGIAGWILWRSEERALSFPLPARRAARRR
ncbi:MAG: LptF/LptG family permease [Deltaproteobacteria bacterium]|nr:LptF/LptG family permease [Deltaproteobacteria bacterium]